MASKSLTTESIALTEKKVDMTLDDIIRMSKKTTSKEKNAPRRQVKAQGFLSGIASQRSNKLQRYMDSRASLRQGILAQRRSNFGGNQFPLTTNAARRDAVMPIRNVAINWNKPRGLPAAVRSTAQRRTGNATGQRTSNATVQRRTGNATPQRRTGNATAQRRTGNGVSAGKDTMTTPPKQRPQTLDALFASMKENRTRVMSSQQQALRDDNHQVTRRQRGQQKQQHQRQRWNVRLGAIPDRRQNF